MRGLNWVEDNEVWRTKATADRRIFKASRDPEAVAAGCSGSFTFSTKGWDASKLPVPIIVMHLSVFRRRLRNISYYTF